MKFFTPFNVVIAYDEFPMAYPTTLYPSRMVDRDFDNAVRQFAI